MKCRISIEPFGNVNDDGRQRFLIDWIDLDGRRHGQAYFANPAETIKRLRHNIAAQFWFDRKRK